MSRGIRSFENGGPVGGPIWDWLRKRLERKKPKRPSRLPSRLPSDLPLQADSLVGQSQEDLLKLLALQPEGAWSPEGGQQIAMEAWRGPAADSLATLHEQLMGDHPAPDLGMEIAEAKGWSPDTRSGRPSWRYIQDLERRGLLEKEDPAAELTPREQGIAALDRADIGLPIPAPVLGYANLAGNRIALNPYTTMRAPDPNWQAIYDRLEPREREKMEDAHWATKKRDAEDTLAHEYSHLRRGPTEVHEYERGPSYGDPQEVAAAAWQALRSTQDPAYYEQPTLEDAVDYAEEWYRTTQGRDASEHTDARESLEDELKLFLKQPIYEGHRIRTGQSGKSEKPGQYSLARSDAMHGDLRTELLDDRIKRQLRRVGYDTDTGARHGLTTRVRPRVYHPGVLERGPVRRGS